MPQEQEISPVKPRDHLSALGHREEHCLEYPPSGVPQPCYEVVQNKCAVDRASPCDSVITVIAFSEGRFERTRAEMHFESSIDVRLKYAVGAFERWISVIPPKCLG